MTLLKASPVNEAEILKARSRLEGIAFHTWVFRSRHFDRESNCYAFFKSENMQRSGSIHFRGIFNKLRSEMEKRQLSSVYTFNGGNYGAAIALAAQLLGLKSTAILCANENHGMLDAMKTYGARIVLYDTKSQNREEILRNLSAGEDATFLMTDWMDPLIAAGEATALFELIREQSDLDCCVAPFFSPLHFSSLQHAVQIARPGLPLFGVEMTEASDKVTEERQILTVDHDEMVDTMLFLLSRMKFYADPSGAATAAAVRFRKADFSGKNVGVVISSGNMSLLRLADYASRPLRNPLIAPEERYVIRCYNCREPYDALQAVWCNCLTVERTFVCPNCSQCFCKSSKQFMQEFWDAAPQRLWDKSVEEHHRQHVPMANTDPLESKRPLVLIVDDEKEIQRMSVRLIAGLGYGTILAKDGEEGLRLAGRYLPELILTAALLPKMDGREMCRRIKANPKTASMKVIITTALYTQSRYKVQAFREFHADEYVSRPLSLNQLQSLLEKHLG